MCIATVASVQLHTDLHPGLYGDFCCIFDIYSAISILMQKSSAYVIIYVICSLSYFLFFYNRFALFQ